jgi:3-oxoacyl-[acyl-carrier-protein] synthase II
MSAKPIVVVTGLGVVSPLGLGWEAFWRALLEGRNAAAPITHFDATGYSTRFAAEVRDFDPAEYVGKKEARRMDRCIQFGVAAARMALEDSGLQVGEANAHRIGVSIGSGIGGMQTFENQYTTLSTNGPGRISPFFIPMMIPNMPAGQVGIQFGLKGPNFSTVSACATGAHCLAAGVDMIRMGRADVVLAGGTEAAVTPLAVAGFCSMKAMSTRNEDPLRASRPFDRERDGFVIGEGAGVLVLESLTSALARGARIYGEVAGHGSSADAFHITQPDPSGDGAARAMWMALADAGMPLDEVDYVNAHGTSTPVGDPCEVAALHRVFGEHARKLVVSSTKSMMGHTLGAAGALESIVCVLATREGMVPPTINYEFPDPQCDLDFVPNVARSMPVRAALNNSFGFGGQNAVVAIRRYDSAPG